LAGRSGSPLTDFHLRKAFGMSLIMKVEWIISCSASPTVTRPCARCGRASPFGSTGKFRLNANGNRLDAWLIYCCLSCGKTWNRPVFERRPVGSVSRRDLEALHSNDTLLADRLARNGLTGALCKGRPKGGFVLKKRHVTNIVETRFSGLLVIRNPDLDTVRLDQVLATGLGSSRMEICKLAQIGVLRVQDTSARALRRPVPAKLVIEIHACEMQIKSGLTGVLLE